MKRWDLNLVLGFTLALAFAVGWAMCMLVMVEPTKPALEFSGGPSRGVFVPAPPPPTLLSDGTVAPRRFHCLVAVVDDNPGTWHYRVWRDDESKALTGKGIVVVPQ